MSTEAIFITAIIDTWESQHVAVVDVPGAFMQVDMDEGIHVHFHGEMVKLLLDIDQERYQQFVVMEKGESVMYVELLKALYGTLRAAQLFWEKLPSKLTKDWGFAPNQYDECVVNKKVDGSILTIAWHVDDLKISHEKKSIVDKFIQDMEKEFSNQVPLTISHGPVIEYLGMTMNFTRPGLVTINMENYVKMMLHDAPTEMDGLANTPAAGHLFRVNDDAIQLSKAQQDIYVHLVMQGLYLSQ